MSMRLGRGGDFYDDPEPGMLAQLSSRLPAGCALKELRIDVDNLVSVVQKFKKAQEINSGHQHSQRCCRPLHQWSGPNAVCLLKCRSL